MGTEFSIWLLVVGMVVASLRPKQEPPIGVQTTPARRASITRKVIAAGKLQAATQVKLSSNISGDLLEHANSCAECSAYLEELEHMRTALNESELKVLPGELDDLTFEKIILADSGRARKYQPARVPWPLKWILAPAAVGVIAVLIVLFSGTGKKNVGDYTGIISDPYSDVAVDSTILSSDSLSIELLSSIAGNDADLDHASDELLSESDIDDILGSLTTGELKALYDKLNNLKG